MQSVICSTSKVDLVKNYKLLFGTSKKVTATA